MSEVLTTCGFCSCGCGAYVEAKEGRVSLLCPSANHPVSTGRLCMKGWHGIPAVLGPDRLRTPLIRKGDALEPATWEEAISFTASSLKRISSGSGPQAIGVIGSAKTTNEECYSLAKFARSVLRTPHVDSTCRFYDASLIHGLLATSGTAASEVTVGSVAEAGSILAVGANVMEQLAHIGSRSEDAAGKGCQVVAADPRTTRLAPHARLFLHPKPGTDLIWIRALIKTILDRKLYVASAPEAPGFEELRISLDDDTRAGLESACGISPDAIGEAAAILAGNSPFIVMFGLGVLQQASSTEIVKALADVAILLGGSIMPLRGQNNAQGASDLGPARDFLPGYARVTDPDARAVWETTWACSLPSEPGMSAVEMIRACKSGDLKALLVFGENVALSAPSTEESVAALNSVEFLAVADLYLTETAQLADVVFPACSFLEKDGSFTNIERRVQRVRKVLDPIGESRSDLDIIADLAEALGSAMTRKPADVMSEIAVEVPLYAGMAYESLDESWEMCWPISRSARGLAPIPARDGVEDKDYPLGLIAGRVIFHQQTGTMSSKSNILKREYPEAWVEMNPSDAEKLDLNRGKPVTVSSKTGSVTRILQFNTEVSLGCVHVPHFFGGDSPNALAPFECDPVSGVPAYKACPVKVEAAK